MANINNELNKIKNAVYGKEVRGSIHNGIDKINKETECATVLTNETEVRQSSLEQQFDDQIKNMTLKDPSSAELVAAQTNTNTGESFKTIGQRLDVENKKVTTILKDKANNDDLHKVEKGVSLSSYVGHGKINLPEDFNHNINFDIYRDVDGEIKHNFNIDFFLEDWKATYIYLSEDGNDDNFGTSKDDPIRSLDLAIDLCENGTDTHYIIKILTPVLTKSLSQISNYKNINKNIAIVSEKGTTIGKIERGLQWSTENGVYKTDVEDVQSVYDVKFKGIANTPYKMVKVNTLDSCKKTRGSWYQNGVNLYVNRIDKSNINNNEVFVKRGETSSIRPFSFHLDADVELVFNNINIITESNFSRSSFECGTKSGSKGHLILHNTNIIGSNLNGVETSGIKNTWTFDVTVTDVQRDGFNYHNTIDANHFIFEYNSTAFCCGVEDENDNNNATSAHESAHILRINSKGWNTKGPLCADVNGCYSILYDGSFSDSLSVSDEQRVAYQFANNPNDHVPNPDGKAILINCEGGGVGTKAIESASSFGKIQIRNFKGDYSKINAEIEFIE